MRPCRTESAVESSVRVGRRVARHWAWRWRAAVHPPSDLHAACRRRRRQADQTPTWRSPWDDRRRRTATSSRRPRSASAPSSWPWPPRRRRRTVARRRRGRPAAGDRRPSPPARWAAAAAARRPRPAPDGAAAAPRPPPGRRPGEVDSPAGSGRRRRVGGSCGRTRPCWCGRGRRSDDVDRGRAVDVRAWRARWCRRRRNRQRRTRRGTTSSHLPHTTSGVELKFHGSSSVLASSRGSLRGCRARRRGWYEETAPGGIPALTLHLPNI